MTGEFPLPTGLQRNPEHPSDDHCWQGCCKVRAGTGRIFIKTKQMPLKIERFIGVGILFYAEYGFQLLFIYIGCKKELSLWLR
jgi:hypothetical protein